MRKTSSLRRLKYLLATASIVLGGILLFVCVQPDDVVRVQPDDEESLLGRSIDIEGLYLDGTEIDWKSYRGKYVLVDFWTTWCGFCIQEIPFNKKLYERYHDAGFEIIAFSCDDDLDALRAFAEKNPEPWKIASAKLSEQSDKNYASMPLKLRVDGYPTMILFDPEGKIVDLNARGNHLKELLEKAFPDAPPILTPPDEDDVVSKKTIDGVEYGLAKDAVIVLGADDSVKELNIPDEVEGLPVLAIGEEAFMDCSSLKKISVPDNVAAIGNKAFEGCSSLTSIVIPKSVTEIGERAFRGCSSLTAVVIQEGVEGIGREAFEGCSALTLIEIPGSVTTVGDEAFRDCSSLTSVVIPEGVTEIGNYAFLDCSVLKSIEIPKSVTAIGEDAFSGCNQLTIRAPKGSYAEKYADDAKIKFELLE